MKQIPLFGPGEGYRSRTVSKQRRRNLYLEQQGDPDQAQLVMYGTPGRSLWQRYNPDPFPARGARVVGNAAYIAAGQVIARFDPDGFDITIGFITGLSTRVSMSDNGLQLIAVDGVNGYIYDFATSTFGQITDPNFPSGATTVTFLAGYFIVNNPGTGQFHWSALYDGTSWDGLDFATAESNPDDLVAVFANQGVLYLFGQASLEFWSPTGDTRVWGRIQGAGVEWSLPSPWTVDRFGDDLIALLKNRMGEFHVGIISGTQVVSVSTADIAHDMNQQEGVENATGFSFMLDNHAFFQVNFASKSYLFNRQLKVGLEEWSERGPPGERDFAEIRFELLSIPYFTDYQDSVLYTQSLETYTDGEFNEPIVREWESKHVAIDMERITVDELQVQFEPGVGLISGQGSNPQAMLQVSRDGGATYGFEKWVAMGRMGAYVTRAIWRMLGRARDWVFRLRIADPVKVAIANIGIRIR